jgi:hypothetical protein
VTPAVVETVRRTPLLALRFRDEVTGEVVRDLGVRLTMPGLAAPAEAVVTPSGVFAWRTLPGLAAWALGDDTPVASRLALVRVTDPRGRYLAYNVTVTVPLGDIADVPCGSPRESEPRETRALPLFSAPGRTPPPAMAVVRGALLRAADREPAAYATLQLTADTGETARGISDERGQVVVFLPYPKVARTPGSGPFGARQALTQMQWELAVAATVPNGPIAPKTAGTTGEPPDLCSLLDQTPALLTTRSPDEPPRALSSLTITYGRELVLPLTDPSQPRPELLVGP